jgi:hypothetical protein
LEVAVEELMAILVVLEAAAATTTATPVAGKMQEERG